ncbi:PREDICTED: uncharacterized protein LOC109587792 [Amphimedon queenslandica]|uniref:Calx-beta domain-containing protein n=1 Tax=Amphimedon queenslandica TaxID=400682 RepID=A0A1X7VRH9_AMPQE|nr:PREDICTED: uncharacterized protein LOC109587792 [Amphimedon queenslandica]|eukprot:XP_019859574.1 PREDICTED: uncharacterized protein LOC109587792 [Amphimedon queenslandica]
MKLLATRSSCSLKVVILLIISLQQCNEIASNLSSYGNEFYLAFPRSVNGAQNLTLTVHTLKSTSVQYSIESLNQDFSYSSTTTAGDPDIVAIPLTYEVLDPHYNYRRLGLHIASLETEPVSIVVRSENQFGFFSFLGLPCHTQPTNSYVYYAVSSYGFNDFFGYVLLVGCMNNTNVTVIPTQHANFTMSANPQSSISASKTYRAGESNTFVIHAGQTIKIIQAFADISGIKIMSDAPLTVISGHIAAEVPLGIRDADPMATQVTPTITWGKEFLLSPHHNRESGQFYKIIADRNRTNIQRRCGTGPAVNATLFSGQVYEFNTSSTSYCSLISNKPIYVAHVGPSTFFNGASYGDPTLNTVPPINQYIHSIEYTSFFVALSGVSLLMPRDQYFTSGLILDNNLYSISWDSIIYFPNGTVAGYGFHASTSGTHTLTHLNTSGGIFLSVYGWLTHKGFAFSGGMGLNPINPQLPLPLVSFTRELFIVTEGNGNAVIYLNRSVNDEEEVSVRVSVTPQQVNTAEGGDDYMPTSVVVTFREGETLHSVAIAIIDDSYAEPTEYFSVRLEAVGQEVAVFPITECVVEIRDDDYIQIGFSNSSLIIDSTELLLDVSNYHGILQSGETSTVQLQVEDLSGTVLNITRFDFYNYSGRYVAGLNLSHLPFSLIYNENNAVLMGKLAIDKSNINVTLEPSVATIIYTQQKSTSSNAPGTTTPLNCATSEVFLTSTVYITPTPNTLHSSSTCPSITVISTVYTRPITTLFTSSCETVTNIASTVFVATTPLPSLSVITITIEKTPLCSATQATTTTMQSSSLNSNVIVGGVMGYIIIFILCIVGGVGGFFCGRSVGTRRQRMTMVTNDLPVITSYPLAAQPLSNPNDYEGSKKDGTKNQCLPLPMLPYHVNNNGEEIYDDIYMEMDNIEEEKKETKSSEDD